MSRRKASDKEFLQSCSGILGASALTLSTFFCRFPRGSELFELPNGISAENSFETTKIKFRVQKLSTQRWNFEKSPIFVTDNSKQQLADWFQVKVHEFRLDNYFTVDRDHFHNYLIELGACLCLIAIASGRFSMRLPSSRTWKWFTDKSSLKASKYLCYISTYSWVLNKTQKELDQCLWRNILSVFCFISISW